MKMYWILFICSSLALLGRKTSHAIAPTVDGRTCSYPPEAGASLTEVGTSFESPSSPADYSNSIFCNLSLIPVNTTFTQMTFQKFDVESWHDYIKFSGPTEFLLFGNATNNQVIVTGYPNETILSEFVSDADTNFSGFTFSAATVTAQNLLTQLTDVYNATSQIMDSPLYITSYDDADTSNTMDVLAINLPNDTNTPIEAWPQYVALVGLTESISIYNNTPTSFSVNWTRIEATIRHKVTVLDQTGTSHGEILETGLSAYFSGLPSGTQFTVTVMYLDKLGYNGSISANGSTSSTYPSGLSVSGMEQTKAVASWEELAGATNYRVDWGTDTMTTKDLTVTIDSLTPGTQYNVSIAATFGTSGGTWTTNPQTVSFTTAPANVTVSSITVIGTTKVDLSWTTVQGAEKYEVILAPATPGDTIRTNYTTISDSVTNLIPGTYYSGSITAFSLSGKSFPTEFNFTTKLLSDTHNASVSGITVNSLTVSWTSVDSASHIFVDVRKSSNASWIFEELVSPVGTTQKTLSNLSGGTKYVIAVIATSNAGANHTFNVIQTQTDTAPPSNIRIESPTSTTNSSFVLNWDTTEGAISYSVAVKQSDSSIPQSKSVISPPTEFTGLRPGKAHEVSVTAVYETGQENATARDLWTLPADVKDLFVRAVTESTFEALWNVTIEPNVTYTVRLLRITSGQAEKEYENASSGQEFKGAIPGRKYRVSVKARNPSGESQGATESEMFETALSSPKVRNESVSKRQFRILWDEVKGASRYQYKCGNNISEDTKTTYKLIVGLEPSTEYHCNVTAYSDDGVASVPGKISVTTAVNPCDNPVCFNGGTCQEQGQGYKCQCPQAYDTQDCKNVTDWCTSRGTKDTCKENSECRNDPILLRGVCECQAGFRGNGTVGCVRYCDANNLEGFHFDLTDVGATAYSLQNKCPESGRYEASVVCKVNDADVANFVDFTNVSCSSSIASVIATRPISNTASSEQLKTATAEIQLVTSNSEKTVAKEEVKKISEYVAGVSEAATAQKTISTDVLGNVVNVVDNLIRSNSLSLTGTSTTTTEAPPSGSSTVSTTASTTPVLSAREQEKQVKRRILQSVNNLANNVEIPENETSVNFTTASMLVTVTKTPVNQTAWFSPVYADVTTHNRTEVSERPVNISIPTAALEKAKDANGLSRVSFFLYLDSTLFPSDTYSPGLIVAANVGNDSVPIRNLKDPIEMNFSGEKKKPGVKSGPRFDRKRDCFKCGYWNVTKSEWSYDGCGWVVDGQDKLTRCQCDHLTNFALLVATTNLDPNVPLETASVIGLSLSMLGLVLTIIIHTVKEDIRKRRPTQILFHICTNLLISSVIFIVGIERNENRITCTVIASFMHFFYLTTWCWMAVYSYDMYRSLVMVFGAGKSRYMTKCTLFGYGVPLLITALDVGIAVGYFDKIIPPNIYVQGDNHHRLDNVTCRKSAYVSENVCWIHSYSLSMGFLVPVAIMLAFNVFVYSMVLRTLYRRGKSVQSSAKKTSVKDNFFISVTLIASTGIAWVFGYLMLLSKDATYLTAMSWVFAILNTIQGLVIFLSTCVRNETMRNIWLQPLLRCCGRDSKYKLESTSKSSSENTYSTATRGTSVQSTTKPLASESNM